jgi:Tfp pilus assembly protein PilO
MDRLLEAYSKLQRVHKIILTALAFFFLLYMSYETEIVPAEQALESARAEAIAIEKEVADLSQLSKTNEAIADELRRAKEENEALKAMLPESPEIEALLSSLSAAAKATGVTILSFEPKNDTSTASGTPNNQGNPSPGAPAAPPVAADGSQPPDPNAPPGSSPPPPEEPIAFRALIDVNLMGTFAQIVMFYDKTLHFDRIIHLSKFNLDVLSDASAGTKDASEAQLTSSATFIAFSQQQTVVPASANKPSSSPAPAHPPSTPPGPTGPISRSEPSYLGPVAERSPIEGTP